MYSCRYFFVRKILLYIFFCYFCHEIREYVLRNMRNADAVAKGDKSIFLQYFENHVKGPVINNPNMLNKSYWE